MVQLIYPKITKELLVAFARKPLGSLHLLGAAKTGKTEALKFVIKEVLQNRPLINPIEQLNGPSLNLDDLEQNQDYSIEAVFKLAKTFRVAANNKRPTATGGYRQL